MKVVSETLKMVDYEEKEEIDESEYRLAIRLALIDLIYGINKDTCHKMSLVIITVQFITFFTSCILQLVFNEYKHIISVAGAVMSMILMCLVLINSKISETALNNARAHRKVIDDCIDELLGGKEEVDEGSK